MKLTTKVFNPFLDTDVLVHRIVGKFKLNLITDEWFGNSTEDEKILALMRPVGDEIDLAVNVLKGMGYNVKNEDAYFGAPVNAIKYYPNKPL